MKPTKIIDRVLWPVIKRPALYALAKVAVALYGVGAIVFLWLDPSVVWLFCAFVSAVAWDDLECSHERLKTALMADTERHRVMKNMKGRAQ